MAVSRVERRLAAILAADVVGYSRLMEPDEAGTLARSRRAAASCIEPLLTEHQGRDRQADGRRGAGRVREGGRRGRVRGDDPAGRRRARQRCPRTDRILFRIGINLGDVVGRGATATSTATG